MGIGLLFVFFGDRKFSCNIFPNERVLTELKTKKIIWDSAVSQKNLIKSFTDEYLKDSVFSKGKINFEKSEAQREPFPRYLLDYKSFNFYIEKKRDCLIILDVNYLR